MISCPGLKIYEPDFFSLLDNALTNAARYGLTNALYGGHTVDAVDAYYSYGMLPNINLNGPGANYIFWDDYDPSSKAQAVMAETAFQLISPPQIGQITSQNGTNQLESGQCAGGSEWRRVRQHESGADVLDHGDEFQKHQHLPTGFRADVRPHAVLSALFPLRLDLAVTCRSRGIEALFNSLCG